MKTTRCWILMSTAALIVLAGSALAAPIESVDSSSATVAWQKVDSFLGEQIVADQLQALGLDPQQARTRLARLSDAQLEQLAAQIDLVKAGGTIQGSGIPHMNPVACIFQPLGRLIYNIYQLLFCWGNLR